MTKHVMRASVSVVIPCYCCAETIRRAVDSVVGQSVLPRELILVDDASNDNGATLNAVIALQEDYSGRMHIEVIALGRNSGPADARNEGWDAATQAYISFLDADDAWLPDKIKIQYNFMLSKPDVDICGHLGSLVGESHRKEYNVDQIDYTTVSKRGFLLRNYLSTSSVMLKRKISLRFESGGMYCEDYALWLLLSHLGYGVVRINIPLGRAYKAPYGGSGLSAKMWKMERGELYCFNSLYRKKLLGMGWFLLASFFSIMRFCRRLTLSAMYKFTKG